MSDDFDAAAAALDPGNLDLVRLMSRIVLTVEGGSKRETPVRTGHLRRSETSRVERAGERGVIGTNVKYAPFVHRRVPFFRLGLATSRATIDDMLAETGQQFFSKVKR
ncbi:MAG TPA: hypothetical protein VFS21_33325 [Roseiflexaceae bacterium]|nr:hypothetical protein [Roseiflexaceae bacterium]